MTLRFRSRQQHLFKDSLGLIKRQIYHPGLIMKIGHEEASEKKKNRLPPQFVFETFC